MEKIEIFGIPYLKKGSGIHIKDKNKGKFTASAKAHGMGVLEFASKVLNNKEDYSPTLVKRANFARNAKKFKHEEGSKIHKPFGHRSILDNGWLSTKLLKNKKNIIPKHQNASRPLVLQNDNVLVVQPVLSMPATNIDWIIATNDKSTQDQQHSEVSTNPKRRNGLLGKIKQRLYNNIIPSGYHNPIGRIWNAIIHNLPEVAYDFGERITRNTKLGDKNELIKLLTYSAAGNNFADAINTNDLRNALWAKYLGLSDELIGFKITDYIEESPYKPPHAKPGEIYYRFNPELILVLNAALSVEIIPKTIRKANPYKQKYNPFSPDSVDVKYRPQLYTTIKELPKDFKALADGFGMGTYTVGKGEDENGEYTSYYDEWDINPFSGKSAKIKIPGIEHLDDITIIGTPIKLYDRTYNIPDSTDIKEKHRKLLIQRKNN